MNRIRAPTTPSGQTATAGPEAVFFTQLKKEGGSNRSISVKMMSDIAQHAAAMANEAMEMAACMQLIVDDCAEQLAAKKAAAELQNGAESSESKSLPHPTKGTAPTEQPANTENPLTIVELRAMVTELSTPENRPRIKGVLTKFGVKKLTELNPAQYQDFMTEVGHVCTI